MIDNSILFIKLSITLLMVFGMIVGFILYHFILIMKK